MLKYISDIYPGLIDMIIYQKYQLVGRFPAKFVSPRISQNTFFHMIGNKSFRFLFERGIFPKLVYTFNFSFDFRSRKYFEIHWTVHSENNLGNDVFFNVYVFIMTYHLLSGWFYKSVSRLEKP